MSEKHRGRKKVFLGIVIAIAVFVVVMAVAEFWYYPHYKASKPLFDISSQPSDDGEISVMSANVRCISPTDLGKRSWFYRADLIVKNIEQNKPDIIGFQEVTKYHYAYLNSALKGYDSVIQYRDNSALSESCPIYYRTDKFALIDKGSFWLSETPEVMSKGWGAAYYRVCSYVILSEKSSGKQFVVFNTHLDNVSDEARINGINVVLSKISQFGDLPAMIMGDFNSYEDSETYRAVTDNFLDAKYQTSDTDTSSCTYQGFGKQLSKPCIDYFMISKNSFSVDSFKVVTNTYDGVYPSDHFPIFMKLQLEKDSNNG